MQNWSLEQKHSSYRLEIQFVDEAGARLRSKTWALHREQSEPAKVILLQANARLTGKNPEMRVSGTSFVHLTIPVCTITGELSVTTFNSQSDPTQINQQIADSPVTLGIVLDSGGVHFSLFTAKPKS